MDLIDIYALTIFCLIIILTISFFMLYALYSTKKENNKTITNLNVHIASLNKELANAKKENNKIITDLNVHIYSLSKELADTKTELCFSMEQFEELNSTLDKALSNSSEQKEQIDFLADENDSLKKKLSISRKLNASAHENAKKSNTSLDEKIQKLSLLRIRAEKTLHEVQLSHLKMNQSIQEEFDALTSETPTVFTYIASLMADYLTLSIKKAEYDLSISKKYHERQRAAKINEIRAETKELLTTYKEAQYQLDYLLQMYPELNDVINSEDLTPLSFNDINSNFEMYNDDPISKYLSRAEWESLTSTERNQLALERYLSRPKTNWEIGRDYELYIAHIYELKGYSVDTFGSYMRINDLGRDLIAKKNDKIEIIQCKYWSTKKEIHENHICQLFGTVICYCIENKLSTNDVEAVFITSTTLSSKAKEFASMLNIKVIENIPLKDFPRIKCNIGYDEYTKTKIYHLPIDPLYDKVKISKKEECYCYSVYEAEELGFRRAYKWHGIK